MVVIKKNHSYSSKPIDYYVHVAFLLHNKTTKTSGKKCVASLMMLNHQLHVYKVSKFKIIKKTMKNINAKYRKLSAM